MLEARITGLERRLSRLERRLRGAGSRPAQDRAVVWAVGDGADGGAEAKTLPARIASERPDHFLYLGDVYDEGTAEEFERNYRSVYGRLEESPPRPAVFAHAERAAPGNHDWPNAAEGYKPYWRRVRGRPLPSYYSFRAGGWELLSLNSEAAHDEDSASFGGCGVPSPRREPAASPSGTAPASARGRTATKTTSSRCGDALRGKATIVVAGQDHDMQRLRPIDGITQFVSGAGGRSHYELDRKDPSLAFANDRNYGALRLELRPGKADYAFFASSGKKLDSGAIRCSN